MVLIKRSQAKSLSLALALLLGLALAFVALNSRNLGSAGAAPVAAGSGVAAAENPAHEVFLAP